MIDLLSRMFSFGFITRAVTVGLFVALCCALLGVSLVLKRYSMIGDGLSHVGFGALSVALCLNLSPLAVSVPVVILSAFFLLRLGGRPGIRGDAAVAVVSSAAIAIGVTATALSSGLNTDVYGYMFGSILTTSESDVLFGVLLSAVVLVLYVLFYNRIFLVTFDEEFARATGVNVSLYNTLLAVLTAAAVVVGMRLMGTMLLSSLIIFPALSSMRVVKSYRGVVLLSGILAVAAFFVGVVLSYLYAIPTGASVVLVNLLFFLLFLVAGRIAKRS